MAEDNPRAATKTAKRIRDAVERLINFPSSGRPGMLTHAREQVVPGTPFFLPYRVKGEVIEIRGVIHGAQKWP